MGLFDLWIAILPSSYRHSTLQISDIPKIHINNNHNIQHITILHTEERISKQRKNVPKNVASIFFFFFFHYYPLKQRAGTVPLQNASYLLAQCGLQRAAQIILTTNECTWKIGENYQITNAKRSTGKSAAHVANVGRGNGQGEEACCLPTMKPTQTVVFSGC